MKRAIYDFFSNEIDSNGDYYNIGTFEQFDEDMQDPQARKEFYDFFSNEIDENGDYYNLGTFAEFEQDIARSTAKEIGKASAQATGQAIKEQSKVAHPVTAVQASDRANPFYTEEAYREWLAQQPKSATKQANQELTSGQVTETPTAPSAPKAEDITTTKATATTAEAPKVESTANPVSALQKKDGTPYSAEELQATADKQQAESTAQVAEQPTVQVESVEESQVGPTETDQAKLETKVTKAEGDQKAEDGESDFVSTLQGLYGKKDSTPSELKTYTVNYQLPIDLPTNLDDEYYSRYGEDASRVIFSYAKAKAIEDNGGNPLSDMQLIDLNNRLSRMSEDDVAKLIGEEGMSKLMNLVEKYKSASRDDAVTYGAVDKLFAMPGVSEQISKILLYPGGSGKDEATVKEWLKGDVTAYTLASQNDYQGLANYINAKVLGVEQYFGKGAVDYYMQNPDTNKDAKSKAILNYANAINRATGKANLPQSAEGYLVRNAQDMAKRGQIGTTDGDARMNDMLSHLVEYGELMGMLSDEDKAIVLERANKMKSPYDQIKSIEDACFGGYDLNWNIVKDAIVTLKQQQGVIQSMDDNIAKVEKVREDADGIGEYVLDKAVRAVTGPAYYIVGDVIKDGVHAWTNPDLAFANYAMEYYKDAKDILEDGKDSGFVGFMKGLGNSIATPRVWDFGARDLQMALAIKAISEKWERNEELTEAETMFMDAVATNIAAQALTKQSTAYQVGSNVGGSIPYLIEMALPVKGGKTIASKVYKWAVNRVERGALKNIIKYASKLTGGITEAGIRTATIGVGRVAEGATKRLTPEINLKQNEKGGVAFDGFEAKPDKSVARAIGESAYEKMVEYWVEKAGRDIFKALGVGKARKLANDFLKRKGIEIPKNTDWNAALKAMAYNGSLEEFGEEMLTAILQTPVNETTLDANEKTGVFNADNITMTALTTYTMSALLNAPNVVSRNAQQKKFEQQLSIMSDALDGELGESWNDWKSAIDNATYSEVATIMDDIRKDKNLAGNQKELMLRYAVNKNAQRELMSVAESESIKDKTRPSINAQKRIEEAERKGANITDVNEGYNTQIRENITGESLARMVGVESISEAKDVIAQRYGTDSPMEIAIEVANDASLNDTQRKVILDYYTALATNQGKQTALEQKRDINKQTADAVSAKTNKDMGKQVVTATRKVDGAQVTIIAGNIVTNEDGSINKEKSDDAIVSVDADGNKEMISLGNISSIATQSKEDAELEERAKLTQELEKAENVSNGRVSVGDVIDYGFFDGNTNAKSRKVVVTDVTTDADGNRMVTFVEQELNGAEPVTMTEKELEVGRDIAYKANNGYQIYNGPVGLSNRTEQATQAKPTQEQASTTQVAEQAPQVESTEVVEESTEQPMAIEPGAMVSLADGSIGEVVSMPEDGRVIVEHEDGSTNEYNVGDLKVAEKPSAQTPQAPQAPTAPQVESTPVAEQTTESAQQVESIATPTAQVEIPTDEKGNKAYEQAPIDATINDIYNDPELDEEEADAYVQAKIDGTTKRIEAIDKKKPKMGEDRDAYVAQRDAWRAKRDAEQSKLDYWQGVQAQRAQSKKDTPKSSLRTNEPTGATPSANVSSTPSPKMDTPKAEPTAPPMESKPKAKPIKVGTKRNAKGQVIGLIDSPLAQVLNNTTRRTLNKLGESLGVSIHIVPHLEGANAKIEGNRITIAIDAEQGPLKALGHELLHRIKSLSPKAYEDFADVVEKIVPSFQARMVATRLVYSNAGRKIDMKLLREEVVADLAGDVMYHAGLMQKFVEVLRPKNTKEIIMDTMRDLYARIRGVFEGEGARNFAKAERVLLDAMKKANKVVAQDETTEAGNATEKLSIIGESGASALDKAEEATIRMDNLAKARKMERFDYPTKSIRMATGWERGADGKWRYEIDDVKLKKTTYENTETTLGELVDNAELFSAYPSLMDLKVVFTDTPNDTLGRTYSQYAEDENGQGVWIPTQISLNNLLVWDDAETESVLAHEIQHAIQSIEGFVNGGDSANKEDYHRLAGEVEARNVQSRMGMTPEQRRATLLAETEDVARKDQIFLMENSGVSAMAEDTKYSLRTNSQEVADIVAKAKADGTYMKAPNGEPTNLTEEQWANVRTKAFKNWFGDWENDPENASKIVDENGEPMVVYHGSWWNPMAEEKGKAVFDKSFRGVASGDNGFFGRGHYFTFGNGNLSKQEARFYGPNITDAFLNIRNPFMWLETFYKDYNPNNGQSEHNATLFAINAVDVLPGLVEGLEVEQFNHVGDVIGKISIEDYVKKFEDIYKNKEFEVERDKYDSNIVIIKADPVEHIEENGYSWTEYGFELPIVEPSAREDKQFLFTHYYLTQRSYNEGHPYYILPERELNEISESEELTATIKSMGYDGVLQSATGDEAVAFEPNQIKSATDNVGTYSSENDDIRYSLRSNAPFYSNAEYAVENIKQGKATPEQWLAMIQKNGGLKAGEDKWLGLSDWLNEKGKRKDERGKSVTLTKEEVLEFIKANQIVVEEVQYDEGAMGSNKAVIFDTLFSEMYGDDFAKSLQKAFELEYDEYYEKFVVSTIDDREALRLYNEANGTNLQVDDDGEISVSDYGKVTKWAQGIVEDVRKATEKETANSINEIRLEYTTKGLDNKREIALVVPTVDPYNQSDEIHFGDAGGGRAVAWVRFGETTDEEGNRVLVIDEIQSKRHQDGREKGYRDADVPNRVEDARKAVAEAEREFADFRNAMQEKYDYDSLVQGSAEERKEGRKAWRGKFTPEEMIKYDQLHDATIDARNALEEARQSQSRVPDAPFEKNWHELAMKRMLRYAAENGFDKVAWTTGAQQAERYSMGRLFNDIEREDNPNLEGRRFVLSGANAETFQVDDNGNITASTISEAEGKSLQEVVGKEMAIKMMNLEDGDLIENEDLRIGGEGMKGFYDKMLPSFMNKYGKKWGVKVGETTMPNIGDGGLTMHSVDVTDAMRESVMEGQPMFRDGSGALSDTDLSYSNDPFAKALGKSQRSKAKQAKFAERERKYMRNRVAELVEKLGIGERVELIEGGEFDNERKARAKGWYDAKSGKIVINLANHTSVADIERTLLHEAVSHHGLRELFGKQFNTFLDNVFRSADYNIRTQIVGLATRNGWDFRTATEEYLAQLAEDTNFDALENNWSFWSKIKQLFMDMLESIGWNYQGPTLTDNELRYLLWRSYENMVNPGRHRSILGMAEDATKREKFGIGTYRTDEDIESQVAEGEEVKYSLRGDTPRLNKYRVEKIYGGIWIDNVEEFAKFASAVNNYGFEENGEGITYTGNYFYAYYRNIDGQPIPYASVYLNEEDSQDIVNQINQEVKDGRKKEGVKEYINRATLRARNSQSKNHVDNGNNSISSIGRGYDRLDSNIFRKGKYYDDPSLYVKTERVDEVAEQADTKFSLRVGGVLHPQGDDYDGTRKKYNDKVKSFGYKMREGYQDSMLALKELQKIVAKANGKKVEDIPSWQNAYINENLMSSKNKAQHDAYVRDYYKPLINVVKKLIKKGGMKYDDIKRYLIAKHGLERNEKMAVQEAKKVADNAIYKREQDAKNWARIKANQAVEGVDFVDDVARNEAWKQVFDEVYKRETFTSEEEKQATWEEVFNKQMKQNRNRDYSGLTAMFGVENVHEAEKMARELVDKVEQPTGKMDELWNAIRSATKETLATQYKAGLLSRDEFEKIRDMYEYYVPLRGFDEKTADEEYEYLVSKKPILQAMNAKAMGRSSLADDPLATIGAMADSAIIQSNRNKMKQAFFHFVKNNPSALVTESEQWYVQDGEGHWVATQPDIPANATSADIEEAIAEHEERMKALKKEGKARTKPNTLDTNFITLPGQAVEHMVKLKINGKEKVLYINGNPRAAQAVNGLTNPEAFNDVIRDFGKVVNNYMAQVFTSKNPAFIFTNGARDLQWAANAVMMKEGWKYQKQYAKNIGKASQVAKYILKYNNGTLKLDDETQRYFNEFISSGGETGYTAINQLDHYKKEIAKMIKGVSKVNPMTTINGVLDSIEYLNRSVEDITRFAVFMTSRQMGRSLQQSAYDAKEITVNFNKKGSGIMGARYLGAFYIFLNASLQSLNNLCRIVKHHPIKATIKFAEIGAVAYALPVLNELLIEARGDDDDKEAYANLPEWVKKNNVVVYIPGTDRMFFTIPLPHEMRPFFTIGYVAHKVMNEGYDAKEGMKDIISAFGDMLPIEITGNDGNMAVNLTPTFLQPIAQLIANTDYFGKPIYRDADYTELKPEYTTAFRGTSPILIDASKYINEISGGDAGIKGKADGIITNPDVLEHLIESYFGGLGKLVNKGVKSISAIWDEQLREVRNIPVVSSFVAGSEERTSTGFKQSKEYYALIDEYKKYESKRSSYKEEVLKGARPNATTEERMNSLEYANKLTELMASPEAKRYITIKGYKNYVDALNKGLEDVDITRRADVEKMLNKLKKELISEVDKAENKDVKELTKRNKKFKNDAKKILKDADPNTGLAQDESYLTNSQMVKDLNEAVSENNTEAFRKWVDKFIKDKHK